jgi:mannose-6-phosphate isomerase-like protein (cupin superfamily)
MAQFDARRRVPISEAREKIPGNNHERFANVFCHGSLEVELYAPRGLDPQMPHARDEVYIVVQGSGTYACGEVEERFGPGDFLFAPAGVPHRFESFSNDLLLWVLFYGPEGGERLAAGAEPA